MTLNTTDRTAQPVPTEQRPLALRRLEQTNWDFSGRARQSELENIHPYPAKFIPEIPGGVLDALGVKPGSVVLDPFVGSGTTLVECQKRGISSVGIDLNPIACLITRVKTAPMQEGFPDALDDCLTRVSKLRQASIPAIPNLDHWFEKPVQIEVAKLLAAIEGSSPAFADLFNLALSSILVRVSNQDSDTRYAAVKKGIAPQEVQTFFATACRRIAMSLQHRTYALPQATVLQRDTLSVTPRNIKRSVGAVITSPPYPNAYEYWLYHKYRMFWLGHDPLDVKEKEIGARAHFFKTNHHTADDFVRQMQKTFQLIDGVLAADGYACFVVGRSKIHGQIIDNARIIEDVASSFGFRRLFKTERAIAANRKSFNLSHANIKTESIVILTR